MRCTYTEYKELFRKNQKIIVDLDRDLSRRAAAFYDSSILGVPVSELIYDPNFTLIDEVVLNTIVDLDRIKNYHPVNNPTRYKYAAYLGFWWERIKPFLCKASDYNQLRLLSQKLTAPEVSAGEAYPIILDISKSVNEIFISDYILKTIQIPSNQTAVCDSGQGKTIDYDDIKDSLEYFLKYRNYNAQNLELFLKGFNVCPMGIM